jgi:NADPH:quinone reductase-like Zn-dependent oxidoreductase
MRRSVTRTICSDEAGKIKPTISERFSLADGGKAIARLAERQAMGKVVVLVD